MVIFMIPEDLRGYVVGGKFIVHKFPEHVFRIKGAWGCNEKRLIAAQKEGAREAFVFSHLGGVDVGVVQLFKSTVVNWLQGEVYVNRVRGKPPERQRLLLISGCELDLKNVVDAKVEKPVSGNLSAWC